MPTATITTKGQTVIPKPVRDHLRLHPGDRVDFVIQSTGDVMLKPATVDVRSLRGSLRRPGRKPVSLAEMENAIRRRNRLPA